MIISIALTVPFVLYLLIAKSKPDEAPNEEAEYLL